MLISHKVESFNVKSMKVNAKANGRKTFSLKYLTDLVKSCIKFKSIILIKIFIIILDSIINLKMIFHFHQFEEKHHQSDNYLENNVLKINYSIIYEKFLLTS